MKRVLLPIIIVVLLSLCFCNGDKAVDVYTPPGSSVYHGSYCVIRNPGQSGDSSCVPMEMVFSDQKVYYEYGPWGEDSLYCEASIGYVLEERMYFDTDAMADNAQCDSGRTVDGDFAVRIVRREDQPDSLYLTKVDSINGITYAIEMVSEE